MSEEINEEVNMSIRRFLKQVGEDSEGRVIHHTLEGQIGTAE